MQPAAAGPMRPFHRRDIGIVATDRYADMVVPDHEIVGRINLDPAVIDPAPCPHPRMHCISPRETLASRRRGRPQKAADIASRHADAAHRRNQNMGEILANAAPRTERLKRWRADVGRADLE